MCFRDYGDIKEKFPKTKIKEIRSKKKGILYIMLFLSNNAQNWFYMLLFRNF